MTDKKPMARYLMPGAKTKSGLNIIDGIAITCGAYVCVERDGGIVGDVVSRRDDLYPNTESIERAELREVDPRIVDEIFGAVFVGALTNIKFRVGRTRPETRTERRERESLQRSYWTMPKTAGG